MFSESAAILRRAGFDAMHVDALIEFLAWVRGWARMRSIVVRGRIPSADVDAIRRSLGPGRLEALPEHQMVGDLGDDLDPGCSRYYRPKHRSGLC